MRLTSFIALLGFSLAVSAGSSNGGHSSSDHSPKGHSSTTHASGVHSSVSHSSTGKPSSNHTSSLQHATSASSGNSSHTLTVHASITANAAPGNATGGNGTDSASKTSTAKPPSKSTVQFTAHPDGQCQKQLQAKQNSFELDPSLGFPKYTTIKKPTFEGAEAKDAGGWNVYWSIPKPDEGCRYQIMLPFQQYSGTPGYPGGNEIINVGSEGCFFGNIPTDSDVYLGFCCGSGDCQKASLNSTSLLSDPITHRRREADVKSPVRLNAKSEDSAPNAVQKVDASAVSQFKPRGGSLASKSSQLEERFWYNPGPQAPKPTCKIIEPGQPYSRAGQQVVVGPSQVCESSPCSVAIAYTISYSTTATSSKSDTLTTSFGASVAIKAGVDFIAEADVTTTLSTEISNAIATTTGMDVMRGNSSTVTNTVSLALGNRGYVTFTPVYQCITGPLDCGNGTVGPIDFCQPDLSGKNGSPNGDFYPLVSD